MRNSRNNFPIRRWAARALLHLEIEKSEPIELLVHKYRSLFEPLNFNASEHNSRGGPIVKWLNAQLEACGNHDFISNDPFILNTDRIANDLFLNDIELQLLRFALLMGQNTLLRTATERLESNLTLVDVCDFIAEIMELNSYDVQRALSPNSRLRQTNLVPTQRIYNNVGFLQSWITAPQPLLRCIFSAYDNGFSIQQQLFGSTLGTELSRRDFSHLSDQLDIVRDYLSNACRKRISGANILLHGSPGTGKTQLARWLAKSIRQSAYGISTVDEFGRACDSKERMESWHLMQGIMQKKGQCIVVFDDADEALNNTGFAQHGFRRASSFGKGSMNTLLESNSLPTIWITNTLAGVDEAHLRRFDLSINMSVPNENVKRRIARRIFKDLPVKNNLINTMATHKRLTPALMEKASKVCRMVGAKDAERVDTVVRQVLNGDLKLIHETPLKPCPTKTNRTVPTLPIDTSVLSTSVNPDVLVSGLTESGYGRICFYGPPGTGKTAFATDIAKQLKRPLHQKQASDIFGPYVGMTERNISNVFNKAEKAGAVLLLDETDSFLQNRNNADKHWQITQVNQFLTSLENFEGYVICTTNFVTELDSASLRRFDFKVEFRCMTDEQSRQMVSMTLKALGHKKLRVPEYELERLQGSLLVPGDFAVALRQGAMNPKLKSAKSIIDCVLSECQFRAPLSTGNIGFI